ncbi:cysteine proteinase [Dipodascopsis uninucleata]
MNTRKPRIAKKGECLFPSYLSASLDPEVLRQQKDNYPGWCTVESDPIVFMNILREIGVNGVDVVEIYTMDADELLQLSRTYGLVFLFKWEKKFTSDEKEVTSGETDQVWFANQVTENSCASLALINIILNHTEIDIGDHLKGFEEFTRNFSSVARGLALANFDSLRRVHNSFASASEMYESSMSLMRAARAKKVSDKDEDEDVFHYVAYVPSNGRIWELDGLISDPVDLGPSIEQTWIYSAVDHIRARISRYPEGEIRFNVMALVESPISRLHGLWEELKSQATITEPGTGLVQIEREIQRIEIQLKAQKDIILEKQEYANRRKHEYTLFLQKMLAYLHERQNLQDSIYYERQQ